MDCRVSLSIHASHVFYTFSLFLLSSSLTPLFYCGDGCGVRVDLLTFVCAPIARHRGGVFEDMDFQGGSLAPTDGSESSPKGTGVIGLAEGR